MRVQYTTVAYSERKKMDYPKMPTGIKVTVNGNIIKSCLERTAEENFEKVCATFSTLYGFDVTYEHLLSWDAKIELYWERG